MSAIAIESETRFFTSNNSTRDVFVLPVAHRCRRSYVELEDPSRGGNTVVLILYYVSVRLFFGSLLAICKNKIRTNKMSEMKRNEDL